MIVVLPLLSSCIREEEVTNTPQGNFEALWKIIDEQYCFLEYKQIDWNAIHDKYSKLITNTMSSEGLFEVLGNMLNELKDGHVNLASAHNVSYYDAWYQDYPRNFREDIVEDVYWVSQYRLPHCRRRQVQDIRGQHRLYALRKFLLGNR